MITIDLRDAGRFAKELEHFAKRGVPYAVRNALNAMAFDARKLWVIEMAKELTLRNKYTTNSLKVEKVSGMTVSSMQAVVGSPLDYLLKQEQGGVEQAGARKGVPIPTTTAAGQAMKAQKRTKVVQKKNYMSAMQLRSRVSGIRQRKNAVAIALAAKKGGGEVFLDLGRRKGIFRISGTPKGKLRVRMLYDLSRRVVRTPRNPMLQNVVTKMGPRAPAHTRLACIEQLKRNRILGYR